MTIKEVVERNWQGNERLLRIDYIPDNKIEVVKSHTMSYLMAREQQKDMGKIMGLDYSPKIEEWVNDYCLEGLG